MKSQPLHSEADLAAPPKILLTDSNRWPAAARLAIALARTGCDVAALCPMPGHPVEKAGVRRIFRYDGFDPLASLRGAIDSFDPDIVIPCCDRGVQHLHSLYGACESQGDRGARIRTLVERSLGPAESFSVVSARFGLLEIARQEGILVPATRELRSVDDLNLWSTEVALPWVIKADGTWGGRGVRVAASEEEANSFVIELTQPAGRVELVKRMLLSRDRGWVWHDWKLPQPSIIAQALITGRPANCAVACWQGRVLAGIAVEVVSAQGPKGPATVVRVVEGQEMMLAAERIAGRLGLSGLFGLDFMIESGTGAVFLIEMNPRCTPLCPLPLGPGRNLADAMWAQLTGRPSPENPPVTHRDTIAYFPQAGREHRELLEASYHDLPEGHPDLIQELLRPWSERSVLGRLFDSARGLWKPSRPVSPCLFADADRSLLSVTRPSVAPVTTESATR